MAEDRFRAVFFALSVWCCSSTGANWSLYGSHHELEGYTIIEVGEILKKHWYDPATLQRLDWFEFNSYRTQCFLFSDGGYFMSEYSAIPSLLLKEVVGEEVVVKIALLEPSFGILRVEVRSVRFVSCPNFYP